MPLNLYLVEDEELMGMNSNWQYAADTIKPHL